MCDASGVEETAGVTCKGEAGRVNRQWRSKRGEAENEEVNRRGMIESGKQGENVWINRRTI